MFIAHIDGDRIQTVKEHLVNTANYASKKLDKVGLSSCGYFCGILHDVGKFTETFTNYISAAAKGENVKKGSVIHTFAGVRIILENYHHAFNNALSVDQIRDTIAEILAIAVGSHHGLFDCFDEEGRSGLFYRMEKQPDIDREAITHFYSECISKTELDKLFYKCYEELTEILQSISVGELNPKDSSEIMFYWSMLERLISSAVIDADRQDTTEFMTGEKVNSDYRYDDIWNECLANYDEYIKSFKNDSEINIKRSLFSSKCAEAGSSKDYDKLCSLDIFTGGGKTLSSLRFSIIKARAKHKKHIIFVAPVLSIIDQNANIIKEAVGKTEYVLEHHSDIVSTYQESAEKLNRKELLTDSWNAPIIITSLVQLLQTLFSGNTSSIRRFSSLCDSVIVLDEVQSVPLKMVSLFNLAINFLSAFCNTTIVMSSATQPCFDEVEHSLYCTPHKIISGEMKEAAREAFNRNKILYAGGYTLDQIPDYIDDLCGDSKSILVICNKKNEADFIFRKMEMRYDNCFHLSAAMCPNHRKKVLKSISDCLIQKKKVFCVSTQVIEAGIDISFNTVIRFLAGMDSVVQAAGRCNRNGEYGQLSSVYMLNCTDENLSMLSEIQSGKNATFDLVQKYVMNPDSLDNDYASAKSIHRYYKSLFLNLAQGYTEYAIETTSMYKLLSNNAIYAGKSKNTSLLNIAAAFKKAGSSFKVFDDDQESIVVPYGKGVEIISELCTERARDDIVYAKKLINDARQYSVNIYRYQFNKLLNINAVYKSKDESVWLLKPEYYDCDTGVVTEEKEVNLCSIQIL